MASKIWTLILVVCACDPRPPLQELCVAGTSDPPTGECRYPGPCSPDQTGGCYKIFQRHCVDAFACLAGENVWGNNCPQPEGQPTYCGASCVGGLSVPGTEAYFNVTNCLCPQCPEACRGNVVTSFAAPATTRADLSAAAQCVQQALSGPACSDIWNRCLFLGAQGF